MFILDNKERGPLHDKIYQQIRNQILSGELSPATKLIAARLLAEAFV